MSVGCQRGKFRIRSGSRDPEAEAFIRSRMAAQPSAAYYMAQTIVVQEEALNEADHRHGHRRVYNPETFRRDFLQAGLSVEIFGGYWLKPANPAYQPIRARDKLEVSGVMVGLIRKL